MTSDKRQERENGAMKAMEGMKAMAKRAAHAVRCWLDVVAWLCWGAWVCSAEEERDARGYEGGTR